MDLSIVVINYNTTEFLLRCLDNLSIACKRLDYEIFIVDNASPEGFPENLPLGDKRLHVIKNNINVGFAKANNQALRECKGNFILLLNPDVEVSKNTIREMVKFLKKQKTAGAVGCKTYWDHSVKLQFSTLKIPDLTTAFFENTVLGKLFPNNRYFGNQWEIDYMAWTTSKPFPVDGLPAAIFMIKKEVLRKVNYFDENFFLYYEDRDLCKRIQEERYEIYFLPHVEAIHHYGQSTIKENSFFLNENIKRSRDYYYIKHYGWKGKLLNLSIFLNDLIAEIVKKIFNKLKFKRPVTIKGDKDLKLSWKTLEGFKELCLEVSVEPHFLHKVGIFMKGNEYILHPPLLSKIPSGVYFWRCMGFKDYGKKVILNSGKFIKR